VITAPDELRIEPNNLGTPVIAAAFGPTGILVAAGQQGGTYDHQLVLVDAGATVQRVVPVDKAVIREALKVHRKFFGSKSESRNSHGWVALGPLALGCLAYDRGITVDVRSDYLLPYLIVNGGGE
jgi:hypothetical protein